MINDILRRFRLTYIIYNIFHKKNLSHNPPLFKKFGLRKKYYSSICDQDFIHLRHSDISPNIIKLKQQEIFRQLNLESQKSLEAYEENGYAILKGFFEKEDVEKVNNETENSLEAGKLTFRYGKKKAVSTHKTIKAVADLSNNSVLTLILEGLLDGDVQLIQSISFPRIGSEQRPHTDAIHLSTYPKGGMVGVWIALESIDEENGAIEYYPQSHKLPYLMNSSYDNNGTFLTIGGKAYSEYEDMLEKRLEGISLNKKVFKAEPGDVLIWHSNLIHAGSPHIDLSRTRKSIVLHYYNKNCIWFHEISQRQVLVD